VVVVPPTLVASARARKMKCHQIVIKIAACTLYELGASNTPEFP
jgi:hypothetical protein